MHILALHLLKYTLYPIDKLGYLGETNRRLSWMILYLSMGAAKVTEAPFLALADRVALGFEY